MYDTLALTAPGNLVVDRTDINLLKPCMRIDGISAYSEGAIWL
jgi:hypothetical protein